MMNRWRATNCPTDWAQPSQALDSARSAHMDSAPAWASSRCHRLDSQRPTTGSSSSQAGTGTPLASADASSASMVWASVSRAVKLSTIG